MSAASPEERKRDDDTDSWGEGAPEDGDDGWGDDGADADGDWGDDAEGDAVMPAAVSAAQRHSAAAQLALELAVKCSMFVGTYELTCKSPCACALACLLGLACRCRRS